MKISDDVDFRSFFFGLHFTMRPIKIRAGLNELENDAVCKLLLISISSK